MAVIDWREIPSESPLPGITRQTVHGEHQTLVRYLYEPGSEFPVHAHPEEQVTVVLRGRIRFTVDGQSLELGAGDVAVIPPNAPHGADVVGSETVESVNLMSPRRNRAPLA